MSTETAENPDALTFEYGPVELFVISLPSAQPDAGLMDALGDLVEARTIRVVDLVIASKDADGGLDITEYDDLDLDLPELDLGLSGLLSHDDVQELADSMAPDSTAAIVVFEHLWSRVLAARLFEAGGEVIATDRIPAPVVNKLIAIIAESEGAE